MCNADVRNRAYCNTKLAHCMLVFFASDCMARSFIHKWVGVDSWFLKGSGVFASDVRWLLLFVFYYLMTSLSIQK